MSNPGKYHHAQQGAAMLALAELKKLAEGGDRFAVEAIRNIAITATQTLNAVDTLGTQKSSSQWPIVLSAVAEIRKQQISVFEELEVGSLTGTRLVGKSRRFSSEKQTGFAYNLKLQIDVAREFYGPILSSVNLPPDRKKTWREMATNLQELTRESLSDWTDTALELCRETCMGDWSVFPLPDFVRSKVGEDTDGNGSPRSVESALRGKISEGFSKLIP